MKGKIIGYRFGGTEEPYVVPITESADIIEVDKQREYIRTHPDATHQAKCIEHREQILRHIANAYRLVKDDNYLGTCRSLDIAIDLMHITGKTGKSI